MEHITLGDISSVVLFVVALIGGIEFLIVRIKKILDKQLEPIKTQMQDNAITSIKSDLINYLSLAEKDMLIGKQKEMFYELYDIYTKKYHQNSYVHSEYERLHEIGKI